MAELKPKLHLFKIGGKIIDNAEVLTSFLEGFAAIKGAKILVHGGGVIAEELAARLGIPTSMHEGRRITSREMRDLVTMVYGGRINKSLCSELQRLGCDAMGLTGADARLILAEKRSPQPIDFGYVGDVTSVRSELIVSLLKLGLTPVFAPLSWGGEILNTNADAIASALAIALSESYSVRMMYGFEAEGVLLDIGDPKSLIRTLSYDSYRELLEEKIITAGMIPKLEECFRALHKGVENIVLAGGDHCLKAARGEEYRGTLLSL